eukprot:10225389-Alexandrium_andersonii.AAC.1
MWAGLLEKAQGLLQPFIPKTPQHWKNVEFTMRMHANRLNVADLREECMKLRAGCNFEVEDVPGR